MSWALLCMIHEVNINSGSQIRYWTGSRRKCWMSNWILNNHWYTRSSNIKKFVHKKSSCCSCFGVELPFFPTGLQVFFQPWKIAFLCAWLLESQWTSMVILLHTRGRTHFPYKVQHVSLHPLPAFSWKGMHGKGDATLLSFLAFTKQIKHSFCECSPHLENTVPSVQQCRFCTNHRGWPLYWYSNSFGPKTLSSGTHYKTLKSNRPAFVLCHIV